MASQGGGQLMGADTPYQPDTGYLGIGTSSESLPASEACGVFMTDD